MNYMDMHCDTLAEALVRNQATAKKLDGTMLDIERLKESGASAQFFAMFLPQKLQPGWFGGKETVNPDTLLEGMYEIYQNTLVECSNTIAPARCHGDLIKNRKEGKISAFLTIENGYLVRGSMERLKEFHDMGVGLMTLTWNDPNCFGVPHSANAAKMAEGLTDFGKEAISYMNELGMLVDVSHLSDGGFYDVAELSKKPFVASHSNCRVLAASTRNLTDEMIRILAHKGGVAGINFEPSFLNKDSKDTVSRVERMCDHVEHFIRIGGADCVGIGTDFDGIGGTFEIADCTQMHLLFEALHQRGLSWDAIEKVAFRNAEEVIRESMK